MDGKWTKCDFIDSRALASTHSRTFMHGWQMLACKPAHQEPAVRGSAFGLKDTLELSLEEPGLKP